MKTASSKRATSHEPMGFTLAELLVASTLLTLVMASVYTTFSTGLKAWRRGEEDATLYREARMVLDLISRELLSIHPGTGHLFDGEKDEMLFYSIVPSLDAEMGYGPRALQIRYRLKQGTRNAGRTLERQEAVVKGALPSTPPDEDSSNRTRIKLGRKKRLDLLTNVKHFSLRYFWTYPFNYGAGGGTTPPIQIAPLIEKKNPVGFGLPHAVEINLELVRKDFKDDPVVFRTVLVFRSRPSVPNAELMERILDLNPSMGPPRRRI